MRRLAAVLLALFLPLASQGATATVQLFEARAHARPDREAPVVKVFVEGAQLSVSEEVAGGWRRVRLPDGGVAWIEDAAVRLTAAPGTAAPPTTSTATTPAPAGPASPPATLPAPAPPLTPPPAAAAAPDLRPRVYVKDLAHLAELVKEDPVTGPAAAALVRRQNTAYVVGGVGLGVGLALAVIGGSKIGCHSSLDDPRFGQSCGAGGYIVAGSVTMAATLLAAVVIHPKGTDLLDVINGWNGRHPDQQFNLGHESGMAR